MSNEPQKVVIYARVSSDRQDVDLSISAQLRALREYANRNNLTIVREFVDEAESGRTSARPAFREMISLAKLKQKPFEVILVWKLNRFARNREDSIIFKSLLRRQGIQVISINELLEPTPAGRMLEGIIEVLDEFYSANLAQDVTRGMRESASRGYFSQG
jgi:DNA invertase Pin-like site-specific DNA recombinase